MTEDDEYLDLIKELSPTETHAMLDTAIAYCKTLLHGKIDQELIRNRFIKYAQAYLRSVNTIKEN